ncbi:MAG: energy transducer TonB [Thiobacillus sp.]|nr:energy transducer TonB [Thiobacillus sp.]
MSAQLEEPSIPPRLQRPLAAIWVSFGLHLALIALVQVAPPGTGGGGGPVIEARLVAAPHAEVQATRTEPPAAVAADLAPSSLADTLPVKPVPGAPPAVAAEPPAEETAPEPAAEPPSDSPVTLTSAVDLTYYSAREVDVHPRALAAIEPAYPEAAEREKLSGKVVLQLKLEADGRVVDVAVVEATPPEVFDQAAVEAFMHARFAPALKNGRPVRALMMIEVTFDWAGRSGSPGR